MPESFHRRPHKGNKYPQSLYEPDEQDTEIDDLDLLDKALLHTLDGIVVRREENGVTIFAFEEVTPVEDEEGSD